MSKHALYNCKHAGDQYRITKFDADANVESSYLTDGIECDCPAGVRPRCRHRTMLPLFKASKGTNGNLFYDFDGGTWLEVGEPEASDELILEEDIQMLRDGVELDAIREGAEPLLDSPREGASAQPSPAPDRSALRRI